MAVKVDGSVTEGIMLAVQQSIRTSHKGFVILAPALVVEPPGKPSRSP